MRSGLSHNGYTAGSPLPVIPLFASRQELLKAALSAQVNKTDRNDMRGIAHMMRVGLFRPVPLKTERSQEIRMLLTARKFLQSKIIDTENNLRDLLRNFGLKRGSENCLKSARISP